MWIPNMEFLAGTLIMEDASWWEDVKLESSILGKDILPKDYNVAT